MPLFYHIKRLHAPHKLRMSLKMLLNGEGVKAALLASRAALTPSPFAVVRAAVRSFLSLGRCPALS